MREPINIVIPLAGHSRRFHAAGYTLPKAFLPIGHKMMIEHVVDMFHPEDRFFFIVNSDQAVNYPKHIEQLTKICRRSQVAIIPPHELGPTYSALQIVDLPPDQPVIISYCDFTVSWNYEQFLREAQPYDAAVPSFQGFHPASFGDTYYAYLKTNANCELLELREKKSYTDQRHNEHASAGIYYFKNWNLFKIYGERLLKDLPPEYKEAYVSLVFNPMLEDGFKVLVKAVDAFICLGTPEDVAQYQYWWSYFCQTRPQASQSYRQTNMIPMAGMGSRFKSDGYRVGKPMIQIAGKPMIVRAANSFPQAERWVFLVRQEDLLKHPIENALFSSLESQVKIIPIMKNTSGQAATCLLGKNQIDLDLPLFIASCDYETIYNAAKWHTLVTDPSLDGAIWTYRMGSGLFKNPNAFAYCVTDSDGFVKKVVEKKVISDYPARDPMVVGSFWYRRASDFVYGAEKMITKNITVNNEHYVGTSINCLLEEGLKFKIFDIEQWISFGDPFELKVYEYWEQYFNFHSHKKKA